MIAIGALVKRAGDGLDGQPVELVISEASDPAEMGAYEELLFDALRGIRPALRVRTTSKRRGESWIRSCAPALQRTTTDAAHGGHRRPTR